MSSQEVLVADSNGGYIYEECGFVYVPDGDLKNAEKVMILTGTRKWLEIPKTDVIKSGVYSFCGQIVDKKNCFKNSSVTQNPKVSEEGLAFIADCINEKRNNQARTKHERYFRMHASEGVDEINL